MKHDAGPAVGSNAQVGLAVQAVSLAGMVTVNALMISMYLRALQQSGSTVATVMNCAANFLLSVRPPESHGVQEAPCFDACTRHLPVERCHLSCLDVPERYVAQSSMLVDERNLHRLCYPLRKP